MSNPVPSAETFTKVQDAQRRERARREWLAFRLKIKVLHKLVADEGHPNWIHGVQEPGGMGQGTQYSGFFLRV